MRIKLTRVVVSEVNVKYSNFVNIKYWSSVFLFIVPMQQEATLGEDFGQVKQRDLQVPRIQG